MVLTHFNDFTVTRTRKIMEKILDDVFEQMTVWKGETYTFKDTCIDIKALKDRNEISIQDYVDRHENIVDIRKAKSRHNLLLDTEIKLYGKITGTMN